MAVFLCYGRFSRQMVHFFAAEEFFAPQEQTQVVVGFGGASVIGGFTIPAEAGDAGAFAACTVSFSSSLSVFVFSSMETSESTAITIGEIKIELNQTGYNKHRDPTQKKEHKRKYR